MKFKLSLIKIQNTCIFDLSWGKGQKLSATLNYPEKLSQSYQQWQLTYLNYYQSQIRGRSEDTGSLTANSLDWHSKLVQAEAKLLSEFHHWLRSAELFEIRATLTNNKEITTVELSCQNYELECLPWEAWELNKEWSNMTSIFFVRIPQDVPDEAIKISNNKRSKPRILVILGDETGLNFEGDKQAIKSLNKIADIHFIGWQPGLKGEILKQQIADTIADNLGWDILLFAGHSNETLMTGGELGIAPGLSINLKEINPQLKIAKQKGLKFALFNSCNGLSLAKSLIGLGLNQVAIMRQPIHNKVAQIFLLQFLQELANYKNVQEALVNSCQYLKLEKQLTYPSAYLIPSLFCYPNTDFFKLQKYGLKEKFKQILPSKTETITISIVSLMSLFSLPIQDWLIEKRLFIQSFYREITQQIPQSSFSPTVLISIDEESIKKAGIINPNPMDRQYLAKIIDKLSEKNAQVIGIDYLLDRPHGESDIILGKSIKQAVEKETIFVFATVFHDFDQWLTPLPEIADPNWTLQGNVDIYCWYLTLVSFNEEKNSKMPLSYLLSLASYLKQNQINNPSNLPIKPSLESQEDFFEQITHFITSEQKKNYRTLFGKDSQASSITILSYYFNQLWLHPIYDFSIPSQAVYQEIPAWKLLEENINFPQLNQQIVLIAPGGYSEAGIPQDTFPIPDAVAYWLQKDSKSSFSQRKLTGGEVHSFMIYHYLNRRFVVPIPDLWMIILTFLLRKVWIISQHKDTKNRLIKSKFIIAIAMIMYIFISLQVFISGKLLIPIISPLLTLLSYTIVKLTRRNL